MHLRVIDDKIFSSTAREEDMCNLKLILLVVGYISRLKVNLDKSTLLSINIS